LGTASLVFGLILIGFGLFLSLWIFVEMINSSDPDLIAYGFVFLVFVVPTFVVGGLLLRVFDKDRKKEKNS